MQIVPATPHHIPLIREVAHITWPDTFGSILSEKQIAYMLDLMYSPGSLEQQMLEGHHFLLAMEENVCYGYVSYQLNYKKPGTTKMHKLYILPKSQGKGVGSKLVNAVATAALQNENSTVTLAVKRDNKAADYYKRIGFEIVDTVDIDIGEGFFMRDYIMEAACQQLQAATGSSH